EANNIAVELARGEFIALVNPDTVLAPDCLQQLVEALRMDASAAVAVPKIDFFTPFLRLSVEADAPFSLARADLLAGLDYAKLFVRNGRQEGAQIHSDGDGRLEVDLPHARRALRLELAGGRGLRQARVGLGHAPVASFVAAPAGRVVACLPYEARHAASARPLVNNAGSGLRADGTPYDRGFGEEDDGRFFSKAYVEALCGCMALVRRVAVMERKLFAPAFFAYFEDSELSAWLRGRGYRILYQPAARVAHRHSESTEEHSPVWRTLVARSGDLYRRLTGGAPLADFAPHYEAGLPPALRQRLEAYDDDVRAAGGGAALVAPGRLKICIYNSYFASMGGGEKHAIDIACALAGLGEVY
ncbi:MAG TPA: glycosyltransferase, partial [Novosphingobium sp.]|nr:glycosyltransferase [Novosphingobium sp.]